MYEKDKNVLTVKKKLNLNAFKLRILFIKKHFKESENSSHIM
jgi:hypothetical protein